MDADDSLLSSENNDTVSASSFPQTQLLNLRNDSSVNGGVTPLEQEVLDEYSRLLGNMNQLTSALSDLSSGPITLEIAESLRLLERKVASVYTLMKASVYSIVLQQGQVDGDATRLEGEGERTEGMTTLPMR
ncbi:hypothetical protein LTR05_004454 [Lithohypha guttulata]|uniref:DASH complex subunit DAD3 n=1 Tax=Lithohypha guttulata TaxID=1690604 RepID=A0AAN7SYS5_9EURO|nr:hypothetical protein LTR05_004454 [Lithohypha guttulata]